jgi:phage terminase large subunit GpA-like protein
LIGTPTAIDVSQGGKKLRRGIKVFTVAVGIAKLEFYNNLRKGADVNEDGVTTVFPAGFVHLPKIDAEFIQQLCAEQLITRRDRNGFPVREWQKMRERNEALDCAVYAYAMACYLGAQSMREPAWAKREERIAPKEPDLFAMAPAPAANQSADAGKPIKNHIEQPLDMVKQPNPYLNRPRQKGPSRQW